MSTQTEKDNKEIICKIMKIQLIADVSSVTSKPGDKSVCSAYTSIIVFLEIKIKSEGVIWINARETEFHTLRGL